LKHFRVTKISDFSVTLLTASELPGADSVKYLGQLGSRLHGSSLNRKRAFRSDENTIWTPAGP